MAIDANGLYKGYIYSNANLGVWSPEGGVDDVEAIADK